MEEKKYELLQNDTIKVGNTTLYRIRALKNFSDIKVGDLGGYIEKEDNLSHLSNCWIYGDVRVSGNARVCDNAIVSGNAIVYDNAIVSCYARVFDNAIVSGNARVSGYAIVYGDARVFGYAIVCDNARVSGYAIVYGDARVFGYAIVYGNTKVFSYTTISNDANISSNNDYIVFSGFGSRNRDTIFFKCADGSIKVNCGCFNGTLDEFESKVRKTHGNNKYAREYLSIVETVKIHFEIE